MKTIFIIVFAALASAGAAGAEPDPLERLRGDTWFFGYELPDETWTGDTWRIGREYDGSGLNCLDQENVEGRLWWQDEQQIYILESVDAFWRPDEPRRTYRFILLPNGRDARGSFQFARGFKEWPEIPMTGTRFIEGGRLSK